MLILFWFCNLFMCCACICKFIIQSIKSIHYLISIFIIHSNQNNQTPPPSREGANLIKYSLQHVTLYFPSLVKSLLVTFKIICFSVSIMFCYPFLYQQKLFPHLFRLIILVEIIINSSPSPSLFRTRSQQSRQRSQCSRTNRHNHLRCILRIVIQKQNERKHYSISPLH